MEHATHVVGVHYHKPAQSERGRGQGDVCQQRDDHPAATWYNPSAAFGGLLFSQSRVPDVMAVVHGRAECVAAGVCKVGSLHMFRPQACAVDCLARGH